MKRSSPLRRSELRRGEAPKRTPFRPKRRKPDVPASVRREVMERSGGRCERCGDTRYLVLHHKLRRSQLGDHSAANLVVLDTACHLFVHDHPAQSIADGWLISPIERPR